MRSLALESCLFTMALAATGCSSILEQESPSRVLASSLEGPTSVQVLVDGTKAAFGCALQVHVTSTGLLSDELDDTQLGGPPMNDLDRRTPQPSATSGYGPSPCNVSQIFGLYVPLQTARWMGDFALGAAQTFTDAEVTNRQALLANAAMLAGYSHLMLGEAFCSAAVDGGPEVTPTQLFTLADQRFGTALTAAQAANDGNLLSASRVGRARALLDLGRLAEARTVAQAVPTGFTLSVPYNIASLYSENLVSRRNRDDLYMSVGPSFRNLTFGGVADPRVRVTNTGRVGQDRNTIVWTADRYPSGSTPIDLATWEEAQLIIAETEGGQAAVAIINNLHSRVGLPSFSSTDATAIRAQIIDERARELFLEGRRAYDIARFNLPLIPVPGTTFPVKGGTYGNARCFPLPDIERNNNANF